jgi:TrmH family RNA methyltransferase
MITKNEIKLIRSLKIKKNREQEGLFVVEGQKALLEILDSGLEVVQVFSTGPINSNIEAPWSDISENELRQISSFVTPNDVVALVKIPKIEEGELAFKGLVIALDNVQDPGNLGSILRSADWFGVGTVICSEDTVDRYNSKVVQASMGAVGRINVLYGNLLSRLEEIKGSHTIYGASLKGTNAYELSWPREAVLLIGNEANGLGTRYDSVVRAHISIPGFGGVESLNASVACSILCSEYRRQHQVD